MPPRFDELRQEQFELLRARTGRPFTSITDFLCNAVTDFRQTLPRVRWDAFDLHLSERLIACWEESRPGGLGFFEMIRRLATVEPHLRAGTLRQAIGADPTGDDPSEGELTHLLGEMERLTNPAALAHRFMRRRHGRESIPEGLPYREILYVEEEPRMAELWRYASALDHRGSITFLQIIADELSGSIEPPRGNPTDDRFAGSLPSRDEPVALRMLAAVDLALDVLCCCGGVPDYSFCEAMRRLEGLEFSDRLRMARALLRLRHRSARDLLRRDSPPSDDPLDAWSPADWRDLMRLVDAAETLRHRRWLGETQLPAETHPADPSHPAAPSHPADPSHPPLTPPAHDPLVWRLKRTDLAHVIEQFVAGGLVESHGVNDWVARSIRVREPDGSLTPIDSGRFAQIRRGIRRSYATLPSERITPALELLERLPRGGDDGA